MTVAITRQRTDLSGADSSSQLHARRPTGTCNLLDRLTTRLAAAETPLAFAVLWAAWAPLYAGALISQILAPTEHEPTTTADPGRAKRPYFSAKFLEIAPSLDRSTRRNALGRFPKPRSN